MNNGKTRADPSRSTIGDAAEPSLGALLGTLGRKRGFKAPTRCCVSKPSVHLAALLRAAGKRHSGSSRQPSLGRPARQLMAGGELEFAEHRRNVALNGLAGDVKLARDLLVGVSPGDQAENLALAGSQ